MLAHVNTSGNSNNLNNLNNNNSSVALFDPPSPSSSSYMMSNENNNNTTSNLSLSVNYIPSKFSKFRNRKAGKYYSVHGLPRDGGGLQAFKTNEARMPVQGKGRLKWNKFKWVLIVTNSLVCFSLSPIRFSFFSQNDV